MRGLIKRVISEPGAETPKAFALRVRLLGLTYVVLFVACCAGEVLLALKGKLLVTLAQRSNVETLTIAFLMVFYGYLAAVSAPGAFGAARIVVFAVRRRLARDLVAERRRQVEVLGQRGDGPWAALAKAVERSDGLPIRFELRDDAGVHGAIEVQGARVSQVQAFRRGSADLLAYFVRQMSDVTGEDIPIVVWGQIDDDEGEKYLAQVEFARALQRHLQAPPLWPTVSLRPEQIEELGRRLRSITPCLTDDALLPDWEYEAEHKLPVIPEPLGLVSLGRSTKRADPVAAMGFATLIVLLTLAVVVLFVVRPPWVPG
ncbi:MAG TPA: hypothetical protein VEP66_21290 [Myxococcales bacterium]|nr:hypothetical protein [Myxococcales bacterium]